MTGSRSRQAGRGWVSSGLNPKVYLLSFALLPQFTIPPPLATRRPADDPGARARGHLRGGLPSPSATLPAPSCAPARVPRASSPGSRCRDDHHRSVPAHREVPLH